MHCIARGQTSYTYSYWLDNDYTTLQKVNVGSSKWHADIDMSQETVTLHSLHIQVADGSGNLSSPLTRCFIAGPIKNAMTANVWFDNNPSTMKSLSIDGNVMWVDAKDLPDGFHLLHVQVNGSTPSSPQTSMFIKVPQTQGVDYMTCLLYVDDTLFKQEKVSASGGVVNWSVDAGSLSQGLHKANVVVVTPSGAATSAYSAFFLRVPNATEFAAMKCYYAIDGHDMTSATGTVSNGLFHFDLDLSELKDGLHSITYMLNDGKGMGTSTQTQFFMKTPLGGNGITQYMYWLNDQYDKAVVEMVDPRQEKVKLISLLPMPKEPIHSDCFHFEMTNGKPTVYAKNIFHIRFHDAAGYFADGDRPFIDYSVKQEVTGAELLNNGDHKDTARPVGNDIKWYRLTAEPGDSVQFRLDRAATVQLFAPSGEEVLSASASDVVKWFGCHVRESGTYYVALHDVTATSGTTVGIDYEHIDKYAVLRQDVTLVGNGGCSTITFEGNGFRDLYAVELFDGKGNTIEHVYIGHESDATTSVVFDFTEAALGTYHAKFRFAEEDKVFNNIVTVEEARDIELATTVTYPSTFLRGTSTTYTIKIENKGNMTAYDVPVEISLSSEEFSNIFSVTFKDINGHDLDRYSFDLLENDSIDIETKEFFISLLNELSGMSTFVVLRDSVQNVDVGFSDRLLTIPPNSTFIYNVQIEASSFVSLYASIPENWHSVYTTEETLARQSYRNNSNRDLCCEKEKWECIVSSAADALGWIPAPLLGCIPAIADLGVFSTFEIMCGKGKSKKENLKNYFSNFGNNANGNQVSAWGKVLNVALGCLGAKILGNIKKLKDKLQALRADRNHALQQAVNYNRIWQNSLPEYERLMREADNLYKQGNIEEAERIAQEAEKIKNFKKWSDEKYDEAEKIVEEMNRVEASIDQENLDIAKIIGNIKKGIKMMTRDFLCTQQRLDAKNNCNPNPPKGGSSTPVQPSDPNDIFGYTAESGSHAIMDGLTDVYYRIEFENDTAFATAPAHDIWLTDTLDASKFDLSTFKPTRIKIGEKTAELTGEQNFVTTVDMRPGINAIAQVEGTYDRQKGIARWHISSLDPMTMEPTKYVQDGVLPVNTDGRGLGEVMYDISLKPGLAHGTEIKNRAGIVFDTNDVIMTPTWTNTIDRVKPESRIVDATLNEGGETAAISIKASDEGSGPWRYDVYVQYGSGAWFLAAENVPADTVATVKLYDGIEHHFYSVARDMAGNVEQKEARSEFTLTVSEREHGDVNGDGAIDVADIADIIDTMARGTYRVHADANNDGAVDVADIAEVISIMAARARAAAAEAEALEE